MPPGLEVGRIAAVEYVDEPGLWHTRVLLRKSSPAVLKQVMGFDSPGATASSVFWVLTATGDVYPESIHVGPDIRSYGLLDEDDDERLIRNSVHPAGRRLGTVFGFEADRGPRLLTLLLYGRSQAAAIPRPKQDGTTIQRLEPT